MTPGASSRLLAGALLVTILLAACATPVVTPAAAPLALDGQEQALRARVPAYDDPDVAALLARVTDALLGDSERATPPALIVLADPTMCGFALPSGHVYVTTGLLARLESEAQLAVVLARLLTQAARRAALDARAADATVDQALLAMPKSATAVLATEDATSIVLGPVVHAILGARLTTVYVAAVTGYDRELEAETDAGALRLVVRAAYDPKAAAKAFERLRREAKAGGALERCYLGQDTALGERIDSLTRLVTQQYSVAAALPGTTDDTDEFEETIAVVARDNARLELGAGRFRAAQEQLDRALALSPGDARAYLALGDLQRLRAQRARSAADRDELVRRSLGAYERAAALDPDLAEVARQLGLLYYQQGQPARAREAFARYLAAAPDAPDGARVREYLAAIGR